MTDPVPVHVVDDLTLLVPRHRRRWAGTLARRVRMLAVRASLRDERLCVDWLRDDDGGVRILLASVPRPTAATGPARAPWEQDSEGWKKR